MTTLVHRRIDALQLHDMIEGAPQQTVCLSDDHRRSLSARFRAVPTSTHRRLDAWSVEVAGRSSGPFEWSPASTRRYLGNAGLRRALSSTTLSIRDAVRDEVGEQLVRATSQRARPGSMASWLASCEHPVVGLVIADALNWATQLDEILEMVQFDARVATNDAYYDVAAARTTLRARRDIVIQRGDARIVVRVRSGSPGKSAGPGLRADLTIETLADATGEAPLRYIGLWPEAGVALAVDGTMGDLRAGARDLVRTAVARGRVRTPIAA